LPNAKIGSAVLDGIASKTSILGFGGEICVMDKGTAAAGIAYIVSFDVALRQHFRIFIGPQARGIHVNKQARME